MRQILKSGQESLGFLKAFTGSKIKRNSKYMQALKKWLNYLLKEKVRFTYADIIFYQHKGAFNQLINMLVLIMKRYIYVFKCKEKALNFIEYIALINHTKKVKYISAKVKNIGMVTWKKVALYC